MQHDILSSQWIRNLVKNPSSQIKKEGSGFSLRLGQMVSLLKSVFAFP